MLYVVCVGVAIWGHVLMMCIGVYSYILYYSRYQDIEVDVCLDLFNIE